MSTYEEIYGKRVEVFSSDPTLTAGYEGQVWYNSTTGTLKTVINAGSWNSSGAMSTGAIRGGGCGIVTAGLGFAGYIPGSGNTNATEEYNGYIWTSGGNIGTGKSSVASTGTQTAALSVGGVTTAVLNQTEEYDGSSWTGGGTYPVSKRSMGALGTQTAGVCSGGNPLVTTTNEYDGSSWTGGGALPTATDSMGTAGTSTAGLNFGGNAPSSVANSYEYDGSSWSAGGSLNTARNQMGNSGTQTSAAAFGGNAPPYTGQTEAYDGTTWTIGGTLGTPRYDNNISGGASSSSAWSGPGATSSPIANVTEDYQVSINVITPAAWASGDNLNTARNVIAGAGTQTSALMIGGNNPGTTQKGETEQYDGTSWTEKSDLNTARSQGGSGGTLDIWW
jgi:hypothetical protein